MKGIYNLKVKEKKNEVIGKYKHEKIEYIFKKVNYCFCRVIFVD